MHHAPLARRTRRTRHLGQLGRTGVCLSNRLARMVLHLAISRMALFALLALPTAVVHSCSFSKLFLVEAGHLREGEVVYRGEDTTFQLETKGCVGNVRIAASIWSAMNGTRFYPIVEAAPLEPGASQRTNFSWSVPSDWPEPHDVGLVTFSAWVGQVPLTMDAFFSLEYRPSALSLSYDPTQFPLDTTCPNEYRPFSGWLPVWHRQREYTLLWNVTEGTVASVDILLKTGSSDAKTTLAVLGRGVSNVAPPGGANEFNFIMPSVELVPSSPCVSEIPEDQFPMAYKHHYYLVAVSADPQSYASSELPAIVQREPSNLTVVSPVGGNFSEGETLELLWLTSGNISAVRIDVLVHGDNEERPVLTLVKSTPNTGMHNWTVPDPDNLWYDERHYRLRVTAVVFPSTQDVVYGESAPFEIRGSAPAWRLPYFVGLGCAAAAFLAIAGYFVVRISLRRRRLRKQQRELRGHLAPDESADANIVPANPAF